MSWMQKLYETYELCANAPQFEKKPLLPVSHTEQQAHLEKYSCDRGLIDLLQDYPNVLHDPADLVAMLPSLMPSIGEVKSGMNPARRPKTEHSAFARCESGKWFKVLTTSIPLNPTSSMSRRMERRPNSWGCWSV